MVEHGRGMWEGILLCRHQFSYLPCSCFINILESSWKYRMWNVPKMVKMQDFVLWQTSPGKSELDVTALGCPPLLQKAFAPLQTQQKVPCACASAATANLGQGIIIFWVLSSSPATRVAVFGLWAGTWEAWVYGLFCQLCCGGGSLGERSGKKKSSPKLPSCLLHDGEPEPSAILI